MNFNFGTKKSAQLKFINTSTLTNKSSEKKSSYSISNKKKDKDKKLSLFNKKNDRNDINKTKYIVENQKTECLSDCFIKIK